jgi:5-formyltetrahydrofolate cyclo-ligase
VNKSDLRLFFKKVITQVPNAAQKSDAISDALSQWLRSHSPDPLGAFVPTCMEPDIWSVLSAYAATRRLVLPKFNPRTKVYEWAVYAGELIAGQFNIPEPPQLCPTPPMETCVVPLLGIDSYGNRLGWGHGFYDRLLSNSIPHRIGIAFSCQCITGPFPTDPWDIPLTGLITEMGTTRLAECS